MKAKSEITRPHTKGQRRGAASGLATPRSTVAAPYTPSFATK